MEEPKKKAVIAFLGNAYHDSRVVNLVDSLESINIEVKTISFDWKSPDFKTIRGKTYVYRLRKSGLSIGYYFNFLFLLIRFLLRNKADFYFAEDVQTLPAVYLFSRLNKGKIFYNSREIYAHLAGLRNKGFVQSIIAKIENAFIRKVHLVLVTGEMDAEYLKKSYSIENICVLRNLPVYTPDISPVNFRKQLNIPPDEKIILYQGVLLEGRGIKKILDILERIPEVNFVIIGEGEFRKGFENLANSKSYSGRIHFLGAVPHSELLKYTAGADLGLALIEDISISYHYALPNKLFEYIMAGVPVLASNLPQMKKVIDDYQIGKCVNLESERELISSIIEMLEDIDLLEKYKSNCINAAKELNWEKEFKELQSHLLPQ